MAVVNVSQGTILKATISAVLTAIAQVVSITGPSMTIAMKEKTNLGDTSKRFRAELPEAGTVKFDIQYDPADSTHVFLTTTANLWPQVNIVWNIIFNTVAGTNKAAFSALISKFGVKSMTSNDNLEAEIELHIDGAITWS